MSTPSRRGVVLGAALVAVLLLAAFAGFRSFPGAGAGEVLVLPGRAHAGPIRVVAAPWSARRAVPRETRVPLDLAFDLGSGTSWPVRATLELRLDPSRLDDAGRSLLLRGENGTERLKESLRPQAQAALARVPREQVLGRPASVAEPLRAALAGALPAGIELSGVDVGLLAPPEQARAAALAVARSAVQPPVARVVYVGLDAADWGIIDPLVAQGKLPTFARLQREGVRAVLRSEEPFVSPILWTTALTGRPPDEHGIIDFVVEKVTDRSKLPTPSTFRRVPALWEMLAAFGQPAGFSNFWATDPAEEVPGILLSDLADKLVVAHDRKAPLPVSAAYPPGFVEGFLDELYTTDTVPAALVRAYAPSLTDVEIQDARRYWRDAKLREAWKERDDEADSKRKDPIPAFLVRLAANSHNVEAIGRRMIARRDLGVVGFYFYDIDEVGHNFMHLAPPPHPLADAEQARRFGGVVEACYRQQDAMLGRVLDALEGLPDTVLIVHSDHGFQHDDRRPRDILPFAKGQPVEWHRFDGMFVAAGGPVRRGARVPDVTLYDIAPLILALRGLPSSEAMPGAVRTDIFEPGVALNTRRIASYDAIVPPRQHAAGNDEDTAAAKAQALEALRGLGYIGDDPEVPPGGRTSGEAAADPGALRQSVFGQRNLANWLMNHDRFREAERVLVEANAIEPLPKSYWMISEARAARGDIAGAIAALEEGFAKAPKSLDPAAIRWLIELHLKNDDRAAAAATLERHRAKLAEEPGELLAIEARLTESGGDPARAREAHLAALRRDPRQVRSAERYAALAETPAQRALLEPILLEALRQDQRIEAYWRMLGLIYAERGDHLRAAEAFHRAVELEPGNEALRMNEAIAWRRAGRNAEAMRAYEQLAKAGSGNPAVYVNLGSLAAQAGDWRAALQSWERAATLGADSPELRAGIAEARRRASR